MSVRPGDGLLHPLPMTGIATLLVNDHVGKALAAGTPWSLLTGKISDVAGLLFFPLLLVALGEVLTQRLWRPRMVVTVIMVVGLSFTAVKLSPVAADGYRWLWGWLRFPLDAFVARLHGKVAVLGQVQLVMDPGDLIALPVLLMSWRLAHARCRSASSSSTSSRG
jgi:hypothetical protein